MRIIIAIFEDVPFLGLNMFLLMQQPYLADNPVFMVSLSSSPHADGDGGHGRAGGGGGNVGYGGREGGREGYLGLG